MRTKFRALLIFYVVQHENASHEYTLFIRTVVFNNIHWKYRRDDILHRIDTKFKFIKLILVWNLRNNFQINHFNITVKPVLNAAWIQRNSAISEKISRYRGSLI